MPSLEYLREHTEEGETIRCTACGSKWEPSFFCETCSGRKRNPHYDVGDAIRAEKHNEPYMIGEYHDAVICGNCCTCHLT